MRRFLFAAITCAFVFAVLASAGCGGKDEVKNTSPTVAPTESKPAVAVTATTSSERQWAFRGQRGITAAWAPTELALYRKLLPAQFDMPESPLVAVAIVNYYNVTLPLTPYSEGYVVLQCRYQGQTGWYVLTMPVDDQVANDGGRFLGFPKYVADRIELVESEGGWSGRVEYRGSDVMGVTFTPSSQPPTDKSSDDPGLPVFLLQPPAEGPTVNEVDMVLFGPKRTVSTTGSAVVTAGSSEAWAGLLPAGGAISYATLDEQTGEWILSGTPQ